MYWTKRKPTKPGWYWIIEKTQNDPVITEVWFHDKSIQVEFNLDKTDILLWSSTPIPKPRPSEYETAEDIMEST
jgi:hypothetical protein